MNATLNDPVLRDDWHPVAIASQIAQGAWEDRCPHLGTPFLLGAVEGDSVRCAYRGYLKQQRLRSGVVCDD